MAASPQSFWSDVLWLETARNINEQQPTADRLLWPRLALWVPPATREEDSEALEEHKIKFKNRLRRGVDSSS